MLRWQNVKTTDPKSLLRNARLVPIAGLDAELPPGSPRATLQQRSAEIKKRAQDYESRTR